MVLSLLKDEDPSFINEQLNRVDWMKNPIYPELSDLKYLLNEIEGFEAVSGHARTNTPKAEIDLESGIQKFWYDVITALVEYELKSRGFFK